MTKPTLTVSPTGGMRLSLQLGLSRPQPPAPQPAPLAPATPPAVATVLVPTAPEAVAAEPSSVPVPVVVTPPPPQAVDPAVAAQEAARTLAAIAAPPPIARASRFAASPPIVGPAPTVRVPRAPVALDPAKAVTRIVALPTLILEPSLAPYDLVRSRLRPTVARSGDTILPPTTVCALREPLLRVSGQMLAAKITDGHQGTIETPFAVGMTSRAVRKYATNEDAIGYAMLLPRDKRLAPVEVFILADGAGGHGQGDAASTAVVDEVLAALTGYNGETVKDGERKAVDYLVAQGIDAADARIKAMPGDPDHDNKKPCATVQVIVVQTSPNGQRVQGSFTWKGDSVGFRFDGHGTVRRQWSGDLFFTVPHAKDLPPTASELEWLLGATNYIVAAVGLGSNPIATETFSIGETGGWFGSTCDGILGDNYGIGNIRAAVRGDTFEDMAHAALVILQGLDKAERAKRKIRARLGNGDQLHNAHLVKPDNRSLWIGAVPTPAEQNRRLRQATQVIDTRLIHLGTNESLTNGRHPTRVLMAAAFLQDRRTQDHASLVLGP